MSGLKVYSQQDSTKTTYDTLAFKLPKKSFLDDVVHFKAKDSVVFNIKNNKAYLHNEGEITYQNINLKSGYLDLNFKDKIVSGKGVKDTAGTLHGTPIFKEGDQEYKMKELRYSFESKKAIISDVITTEGEGFLHGETVKKMDNNIMYIKNGKFTTCPLDHPHFDFRFNKAKIIPNDKIVSGPVYMTIEDVPVPLALPFGFFPNTQKKTSGILLPGYNHTRNLGYSLQKGGYFWGINPYMNLELRGDVYTRGSWAAYAKSQYRVRYKYSGDFKFGYTDYVSTNNPLQEKQHSRGTQIIWNHQQDAHANPNHTFSSNVNFTSAKYGRYSSNINDYFSSTTTSSVSFVQNISSRASLTLNANENYNTNTGDMTITLPTIDFRVNQLYPFRRKKPAGSLRWYENIYTSYTLNAQNILTTKDTAWFTAEDFKNMKNGLQHTIPISSDIKVLKYFNWHNGATYSQTWQLETKSLYDTGDSLHPVGTNINEGFAIGQNFSYESSLSTTLYGLLQFKHMPLRAIRHTIKPSAGFRYIPYLGSWQTYTTSNGQTVQYSTLEGSLYGLPASQSSGNVNFAITNSLDIKVRSRKDTITGTKKITLIDNLTLSSAYDLMRDSLNWSNLNVSGYTNLYKGVRISYRGSFSPYAFDSLGRHINRYLIQEKNKLFQKESSSWELSMEWSLNSKAKDVNKRKVQDVAAYDPMFNSMYESMLDPVDFSVPWDFIINYSLSYGNLFKASRHIYEHTITQSIRFSGNFSLTEKWKINFGTGYDFQNKDFVYTNIGIRRDLHCWEMSFDWVPFGDRQQWTFNIRVKASMLQDLKYDKRKDFRDNY